MSGTPWSTQTYSTWQEHGKNMARTWQEHGKRMARTWQEHGESMARAWQEHGTQTWQDHGNTMARSRPRLLRALESHRREVRRQLLAERELEILRANIHGHQVRAPRCG